MLQNSPIITNVKVRPSQIASGVSGLGYFLRRYTRHLDRLESRQNALMYVKGQLSNLDRKTAEPIARFHGVNRFRIQEFIGQRPWDDAAIREELHRSIVENLGDPEGVLVLDPSAFPKKGTESVGVRRQWCGRLGKVENCQIGVFVGYVGRGSATLVEAQLLLPREWARDRKRRRKCHVPRAVRFRTTAVIAAEQVRILSPRLPHAWVVGDEEFGRPAWFRRRLALRGERYILEVPSNTHIRPLESRLPKSPRRRSFRQALAWAKTRPASAWTRVPLAAGEKGPREVDALCVPVQAKLRTRAGPRERLLVTRSVATTPEWTCWLSNAEDAIATETLARVAARRHDIEECFERAKGEAGLAHYEVRSWIGWHHHMTMSLLALWYLTCHQRRLGEKNPRPDGPAHRRDLRAPALSRTTVPAMGGA
jgi:SRSO17 transposase